MDLGHAELLRSLEEESRQGLQKAATIDAGDSYTSGGHPFYRIRVPVCRTIAREWLLRHRRTEPDAILEMCDSLVRGVSYEEKTLTGMLLKLHPGARLLVTPAMVDGWLGCLKGWAEVDSLCQNVFTAAQMLEDWDGWSRLIGTLSRDANINKRRASLVLLTGPVHYSPDNRLSQLAFATVDVARTERDQLITKAVSWLLRSLVGQHASAVERYLDSNEAALPRIAIRETRVKLETGTKRGRRAV